MTDLSALIERDRQRYRQAVRDLNNTAFWRQWQRERDRQMLIRMAERERRTARAMRAIQESRNDR